MKQAPRRATSQKEVLTRYLDTQHLSPTGNPYWLDDCKHKIQQCSPARLETKPQTALKNLAEAFITGTKCLTAQEIQAHWSLVFSVNDCLHKIIFVLTVTSLP